MKRNPKVGYFQGMNFIAAQLSIVMDEEEAFWTLCQIIESYFPLDYFANFCGVLVDQKVFCHLLQQRLPDLAAHFEDLGFNSELLTFAWFVQMFVNKMPFETVQVVWDLFFLKGVKVLIRVALTVFSILQQDCLDFDRFDHVMMHVQEFIQVELTPESLLSNFAPDIPRKDFRHYRDIYTVDIMRQIKHQIAQDRSKQVQQEEAQHNFIQNFFAYNGITDYYERRARDEPHLKEIAQALKQPVDSVLHRLSSIYKCDPSWPICIFDFSFRNLNPEFVAFKVQADLTTLCIPDYFSAETLESGADSASVHMQEYSSSQQLQQQEQLSYQNILINRGKHICTAGEGRQSFQAAF